MMSIVDKTETVWPSDSIGLDASALIPFELGGTMQPKTVPVSVMDLGKMLLHCSREGESGKVKELMSRGAPFTTDWLGTSPLHVAASNNHYETCEVLLRAGISKNARTKVDRTPLHFACYEGHDRIVELLLANKCEVDAKDMLRMTPLHWSVERKFRKIVDLLLRHGADPSVKSKFDKTPMSIALATGQSEVYEELMKYKMKIGDPEQQQATEGLMFELNRTRNDNDSHAMDVLPVEDDYVSPPPSPIYSTTGSDHMSDHERLNANGMEIDESISKLQSIDTTKSSAAASSSALKLLKHHGISMIEDSDGTLLNSALQSGRKLVLSDAGKLILNDPKFKRVLSAGPSKVPPHTASPLVRATTPASTPRPAPKFSVSHIGSAMTTSTPDALRKKPSTLTPVARPPNNGLKTNKVIKILSAEEFKQMCGANASGNTLKKISTDSIHNGQLKYQTISNPNMLTQLSRTSKKPILNKIKLNTLSPATKSAMLNEIKIASIKPISTQLQKIIPTTTHHTQPSPVVQTTQDPDTEYISRLSFNQSKALAAMHANNRLSTSSNSTSAATNNVKTASPAKTPLNIGDIHRQMLDVQKQVDDLRRQLELSQKQNEDYRVRLEKLERQRDEDRVTDVRSGMFNT